jgi:hypothetical protein
LGKIPPEQMGSWEKRAHSEFDDHVLDEFPIIWKSDDQEDIMFILNNTGVFVNIWTLKTAA